MISPDLVIWLIIALNVGPLLLLPFPPYRRWLRGYFRDAEIFKTVVITLDRAKWYGGDKPFVQTLPGIIALAQESKRFRKFLLRHHPELLSLQA